MIYLLVELLDHHITSFYIKYRFFGVICTFGNFIKINIEFWDQNFVKWLNSKYLSHKVFLGTLSMSDRNGGGCLVSLADVAVQLSST